MFYFVFHLCGGGRISGACDSFDRPPHLCAQAHVKWSQLWLRSRHTITASGTKGNSEKGGKNSCVRRGLQVKTQQFVKVSERLSDNNGDEGREPEACGKLAAS